jgi:hypothetical protein
MTSFLHGNSRPATLVGFTIASLCSVFLSATPLPGQINRPPERGGLVTSLDSGRLILWSPVTGLRTGVDYGTTTTAPTAA